MPLPPNIQPGASGARRPLGPVPARPPDAVLPPDRRNLRPITQHAVEDLQQSRGLAADGIIGQNTWTTIGGDKPEPPTLGQGSTGPVVEQLQTVLNEGRGSFAPTSNPILLTDGIYGSYTATSVWGAQTAGGIPRDGIVGLQTWALPVHAAAKSLQISAASPHPIPD